MAEPKYDAAMVISAFLRERMIPTGQHVHCPVFSSRFLLELPIFPIRPFARSRWESKMVTSLFLAFAVIVPLTESPAAPEAVHWRTCREGRKEAADKKLRCFILCVYRGGG